MEVEKEQNFDEISWWWWYSEKRPQEKLRAATHVVSLSLFPSGYTRTPDACVPFSARVPTPRDNGLSNARTNGCSRISRVLITPSSPSFCLSHASLPLFAFNMWVSARSLCYIAKTFVCYFTPKFLLSFFFLLLLLLLCCCYRRLYYYYCYYKNIFS